MIYRPIATGGAGSSTPVQCWQVRASAAAADDVPFGATGDPAEALSRLDYRADGWCIAPARSTVMAALLGAGLFPDIEHSMNMRDNVDKRWFEVPWWYRTTFTARAARRTLVRLEGVIHRADLFVNGVAVADSELIAGAYTSHCFDVSELVQQGPNALALRVHPGSPLEDLSIGWVDWNQWPPDNNMGVWRDVSIDQTGDLRIVSVQVTSALALPSLSEAALTVHVEVENLADEALTGVMTGIVSGNGAEVRFVREGRIEARGRERISFTAEDFPELSLRDPAVWWPVGEGNQPLYELFATVSVDGLISDRQSTRFGVRTVESSIAPGGGRRFVVNGRPLQVLSAGWAPDLFLRHDPGRIADELAFAVDLGLNGLRLEGKLDNPEFFEMADELGLMLLPGWECCDKWESERLAYGAKWVEHDYEVARRSMASEAVALRNHPSVLGFLIGSDFAPPPRIAELYVEELEAANWPLPVISAATVEPTDAAGPSGMKMTGPYAWVAPAYWYSTDPSRGGAIGFNSETGAGNNIPRLVNLRRMLGADELEALWRSPETKQFHAAPPSFFEDLVLFHRSLSERYGPPASLEDFARKAQLANYEATRAQFEAVVSRAWEDEPATGTVYWMFNSAWPSINWQLYDWYLDPGAAYFGVKKALEPVHVQYMYDSSSIAVVNRAGEVPGPVTVVATVRDLNGTVVAAENHTIPGGLGPRTTTVVGGAPGGEEAGRAYFLALELMDAAGERRSRNVYWLSAVEDVLDWAKSTWNHTPLSQFADFQPLADLPPASVEAAIVAVDGGAGTSTVRLRLRNNTSGGTPAVAAHASIVAGSLPVAPVLWTDNELTLFGGEELVIEARCTGGHGPRLALAVEGFNVEPFELPLEAG